MPRAQPTDLKTMNDDAQHAERMKELEDAIRQTEEYLAHLGMPVVYPTEEAA